MASKKKTVKKASRRAPAKASSARKKPAARKLVRAAKKAPAKKAIGKKTASKKAPAKPARSKRTAAPASKTTARRSAPAKLSVRSTRAPAPKPSAKAPKKPARAAPAVAKPAVTASKTKRLSKKDLEFFRGILLNLRDRLIDGISFLAGENLNHSQREATGDLSNYGIHMADHGTDNFDREFALSLVSNEQEVLYEIEEAMERIDNGTFGLCEQTGRPIEFERLKVLPYARFCIEAQEEREKGRKRFRAFTAGPVPGPATQDF